MSTPNPPRTTTGYTGETTSEDAKQEAKERAAVVKDDAKERAANVGGHAADQGRELKDEAAAEAKEVAKEARDHLKDVSATAQGQLKEQAEQQASRAGSGLSDIGRQMQKMASDTDAEGMIPSLVGSLGDQVSQFATKLQDGHLDAVMDDLKSFARRRPGMFLLGATLAGFASSRVARLANFDPSSGGGGDQRQGTARLTQYDARTAPAAMSDSPLPAAPPASDPVPVTPPATAPAAGSPRTGVVPPERPSGGVV